jgi:hypothetical protein
MFLLSYFSVNEIPFRADCFQKLNDVRKLYKQKSCNDDVARVVLVKLEEFWNEPKFREKGEDIYRLFNFDRIFGEEILVNKLKKL